MDRSTLFSMSIHIEELTKAIKLNLSPSLLKKEYREQNKTNPTFGHCYVATETLYHLLYNEELKLNVNFDFLNKDIIELFGVTHSNKHFPHHGKDENNITHWWLENHNGHILDVTSEQYTSLGKTPPYKNGRRGAFLTKLPSKRSQKLILSTMMLLELKQ